MSQFLRKYFISNITNNFVASLFDGNNRTILVADENVHVIDGKLAKELKRMGVTNTFF